MSRISNIGGGSGGTTSSTTLSPATRVIAPISSGYKADYYTDGVDDQVQINLAITDMLGIPGGVLLIKTGQYYLGSSFGFGLPSNITVRGEGIGATVIHPPIAGAPHTGHETFQLLGQTGQEHKGQNITLENFEWDCTQNTTTSGGINICDIQGCDNVTMRNVFIHGYMGYFSFFANCDNVKIEDCSFVSLQPPTYNTATWAMIQFKGCRRCIVQRSYFSGIVDASIENHNLGGIYNRACGSVKVVDCTIENGSLRGINLIESADDGTEVTGCTIRNCGYTAIAIGNINGARVHHNIIYGPMRTNGSAIAILSVPNISGGINDLMVDHNVISGINGNSGSAGAFFQNINNLKFIGNTVKNTYGGVFNRCANALFVENDIYDDQTVKTQGYGIKVDGGVPGCRFISNKIYNNISQGIWLYSANNGTMMKGNRIYGNNYGLYMTNTPSQNCTFVDNDITNNTTQNVFGTVDSTWEVGHNPGY